MNSIAQTLNVQQPLIQAPMAGGITTPELVAAVSNAGALGSIGAGYMPPETLREQIRRTRALTDRPFSVNLFIRQEATVPPGSVEAMCQRLAPFYQAVGLAAPKPPDLVLPRFEDQLAVVLEERIAVFSFTFGRLPKWALRDLREQQCTILGTATTVSEAAALQGDGVDAVVVQGSEAGGHRGSFLQSRECSGIGLMALLPQVRDRISLPIIAAGGIMDARGILAARVLGADAVQMGTAFLATHESGAAAVHKERVITARDDATVLTTMFSGKAARGLINRFITEMEATGTIVPPYPVQNALTKPLRAEARRQSKPEFMSLWAGQGAPLAHSVSAGALVHRLTEQYAALNRKCANGEGI